VYSAPNSDALERKDISNGPDFKEGSYLRLDYNTLHLFLLPLDMAFEGRDPRRMMRWEAIDFAEVRTFGALSTQRLPAALGSLCR
jgi:hypothetical protein